MIRLNYKINISFDMSLLTLQLLQAFNLPEIARQAYQMQKDQKEKKRLAAEKLTVSYVMSPQGFALAELFGYFLNNQLKEDFCEIAKRKQRIRLNYQNFTSLMNELWINMSQYKLFLPILFSILKGYNNTIAVKDINEYLEICKQQINPFMAKLKTLIPPLKTKELALSIENVCEREDLKNQGFVEKLVILDLIRKCLGETKQTLELDEKLIVNDEVNYKMLLGKSYLTSGQRIRLFLQGKLSNKIKKFIKRSGQKKKLQKKKKQSKKFDRLSKKKETKDDKLIREYMQENKKQVKEDRKKLEFIIKSILYECIHQAADISIIETEQKPQTIIKKSIYTGEPVIIQHQLKCLPGEPIKLFPILHDSGLLITEGEGRIISLLDGSIKSTFNLNPSHTLKPSPICDYTYSNNVLYVIREDGLLFSWDSELYSYSHMVQTQFRYISKQIQAFNSKNVMFAGQGIIIVNCEEINNSLELYSLELEFIGNIFLNKQEFGLSHAILKESKQLSLVLKNLKQDYIIKSKFQYEGLIRINYEYKQYELGNFLFSRYDSVSALKIGDHAQWISSYKVNNPLYLDKSMMQRLRTKKMTKDDFNYLLSYHFIKQSTNVAIQAFLRSYSIIEVDKEQRKHYLITLFEDNPIKEIEEIQYFTREQFLNWIDKCSLNTEEINILFNNLDFNSEGKICLHQFIHGEQYLKIISLRQNRFYSHDHYQQNQLPPVIFHEIIPFPLLEFFIITTKFPTHNILYINSFRNIIINKINLNDYLQNEIGKSFPILSYCQQSGYLAVSFSNVITIWNINRATEKNSSPIKIIKGLEKDPIINFQFMYFSNSIATLTQSSIKFWDLEEVLFNNQAANIVFKIKPGFKAIQKQSQLSRYEAKKKIMIRGKGINFLTATTKSSNYIIGVLSKGERAVDAFLKIFYLCKFQIMIGSSKQYDQAPIKVMRQLEAEAKRMKFIERIIEPISYNQQERRMVSDMVASYRQKLGEVRQFSLKELSITLINKVSNLHIMLSQYSKIVDSTLLKSQLQINEIKAFKFNLLLKIYLTESNQELISIFTPEFVQLYQQKNQLNKTQIIDDIFQWHDKAYLTKFLCLFCQIYKYSLPFKCSYIELIFNQKQQKLDANLIQILLANSQISNNIIKSVVSLVNQIRIDSIKTVIMKVIDKFLPTEYRYPSLRYFKNIYKHTADAPFDYLINRFDDYTHVNAKDVLLSPKGYKQIFEHIEKEQLLERVQELSKVYPQISKDNLQLIDICMSYNLITQQQATFYILAPTNLSLLNLLKESSPRKGILDFDDVIGGIVYVLAQQKVKVPTPHFTYQWFYQRFKSIIGNDDKVYNIFYNELRGSLTQHIAYSRQLQFYIELNKKNIRINYNPINWKHLIGTRIYPLTYHIQVIKQGLNRQHIIDCFSFEKFITQIIPKQAQTITIRACAASKNHESFINNFNEERSLKDYQDDYINFEHFMFYLQESKKNREAQAITSLQPIQNLSTFEIKVPSYCLINQLAKYPAFLTRSQLMQTVSESVSTFTYGNILEWIKSLPFVRMKGKNGKQSRLCAIWELKKYLKINWEIFGWMLLNRYGKINVLNKFIIIEGTIDIKQLNQLFSEALFKLFIACNGELKQYENTYPLQVLQRIVDKQLVNPALQCLNHVFKHQIGNYLQHISQILTTISNKTEEIEIEKFVKYFLTNNDTKESVIKLIFSNLIGRTKKIKIKEGIAKLFAFAKNVTQESELSKWIDNHDNDQRSLLQTIIPIIEPHKILSKKEVSFENLIITRQHLKQLLQKQQAWIYSYQPYFTLTQFFDYLLEISGPNANIPNLINNCVIKHGIHSIFNSIDQGSFPQFYAKCRSVSKLLTKLTVVQFSQLYGLLSNEGKGLSLLKLFKATQLEITAQERITWIIQYLEQASKENFNVQNLRVANLLQNVDQPMKQLQKLVESLKYEEYLVKRYIKSAKKLGLVLNTLQDNIVIYQSLTQLHLSHEQTSILTKYLKVHGQQMLDRLRQSESKATTELLQTDQQILLEEIANYLTYFEGQMSLTKNNPQFNMNFEITDKWVTNTFLFKKMSEENSPQWSCLPSYINLYQYCQHFLVNKIFRKYTYRQMILDQFNKSLLATSLTLKNIYEIFNLAYVDNFLKYFPYFISPNPQHHAMSTKQFKIFKKYLCEAFVKFDGVSETKYPINLTNFKQIMGQFESKSESISVNYGQIYKRLNIWGCGYVNLNDIEEERLKRYNYPYIEINSFISETYPTTKGWRKINPPSELFENREKISMQLIKLEEQSQFKSKLISSGNLWRILGYYLTKQHRLYIEHEFQAKNNHQLFNIVDVIQWINTNQEESDMQNADILAKVVTKIEDEGGIYNIIRKYHKQIILAQQTDTYKQQFAYLNLFLEESGTLQLTSLKEFVKQLLSNHKIEQFLDKENDIENKFWLLESLKLIVEIYNKEIRQWTNYNNNLVKFLNELPEDQYYLIKQLYQCNYQYSCHKLFDILADGSQYFTFTTFWIYNTNSNEAYPYSKQEVHQVYKIIDVNSDGNISYQQFCRFWSAVEQIFVAPTIPPNNKIGQIKNSILDAFLDSIQGNFEKQIGSEMTQISIDSLQALTNIKHKQKLQRLIKIISPDDKFGRCIDTHKLKVLLKQHKLKKNKEMHTKIKHSNYFARIFGSEIQEYVNSRDNLQNTLSRWLVFTFPNFGYYLAQFCYELGWNKEIISKWISQHQFKVQTMKSIDSIQSLRKNDRISSQSETYYKKIALVPKKFELFYKKFLRKQHQPLQYGKSISYKLYLNRILEEYETMIQEIDQISYFLEEVEADESKLIYKFEESQIERYETKDTQTIVIAFKIAVKNGLIAFVNDPQRVIIKNNISYQRSRFQSLCKRQYEIVNKDLRGRSNNRLNLTANKLLYSDPKISMSFYDEEVSNLNKLILFTDCTSFKSLPQLSITKNGKFTSLQSMIKLVDLAAYIQKQYQVIGLFVNLHHICIDYEEEKDFRISQFFGGIKLDSQGNYFQGVNPRDINNDEACIYPPQIYENVFTETFDSYCLAHILYFFFTGDIIENKKFVPSAEESHWFNYSQLHYIAKKQISFLSLMDKNMDIQSQIVFFTLLHDCTSFQWHLRPKVHQISQTLRNIALLNCRLEEIGNQRLIIKPPISESCLSAAQTCNFALFTESIKASQSYDWTMAELEKIRQKLPDDPKFYSIYNQLLQQTLTKLQESSQVGELGEFMTNAVQYLCQSQKKQTAFLALQVYKNIVSSRTIKRYFDYCDDQWKINEFNIHEKLQQLNTENRIIKLPKSSQFYFDLSTLIDTKITLFMAQTSTSTENKNKKHDSTKKIAISFIESSLISHNVNKICALQKSGVLMNLYKYIEEPQFEAVVLKIYCLATSCLNEQQQVITHRAMEEGYKVMMVMHNIINLQRGVKIGETVVDMLTYMNNYYNFYGQQCKTYVMKRLCHTQICNYPTLTFLFNLKIQNKELLYKILLNLTYQQSYWKMLKGVTIQAYDSYLKELKKSQKHEQLKDKLQKLLKRHEAKLTLNQLSAECIELRNKQFYTSKENVSSLFQGYESLIQKHMLFYNKKTTNLARGSQYRYQNNFYEHYTQFLKEIRKMMRTELENTYFNAESCNFIKASLKLHLKLIQIWHIEEQTIKYIIDLTEKIYEKEFLYSENVLLNSIEKTVFEILSELAKKSLKILLKLGFIHFFMRIIKKQHELLQQYVRKGVQNIQLKCIYSQQAEFRLNMIDVLLQTNSEEIHRIFIGVGFPKYLIETMLSSHLLLDLRYYKANFDIVPFRFCSPLRSEAITILSFILPIKESILRSEVVSRLIPVISSERQRLQIPADSPENKMNFVEALWFFGNVIECEQERLQYEFVNNGSYAVIAKLLEKYEYLNFFFPKMSQTMKTGSILKSSMVFSRMQVN